MPRCHLDGDPVVQIQINVRHASTACFPRSTVAIRENVMSLMGSADVHLDLEGRIA
jgi:hypothetical protein